MTDDLQIGMLCFMPDTRNTFLGDDCYRLLHPGDAIIILETSSTTDVWEVLTKFGIGILYCGHLSEEPILE